MPTPSDASLDTLPTPVPVVDLERMTANIERTASYAAQHGLALRPHVKTHKAPRVAAEQLRQGVAGFTCATPAEAAAMRSVSEDLLLAYPPVGAPRARQVAALAHECRLRVALDSVEAVDELARALGRRGPSVGVLVELDLGMHRVGVAGADEAIALARRIRDAAPLEFAGILYYPGHIREPVAKQEPVRQALSERLGGTVEAMAAADCRPGVVSGGSTPTLWTSHLIPHLTEIRPGTSVYNDRTTAAIGACRPDDCALTVLATVVSTAVPGRAVIDAGTKALGREPLRGSEGTGFGVLLEHPEVTVASMSEEHGILELGGTTWRPQVGERVRVVPNHVCIVVHLFDEVIGIREGRIAERWPVAARGRALAV